MKKRDAIAHFGSQQAIADLLGVTRATVNHWPETVPFARQAQLEQLSGGDLKASPIPDFKALGKSERDFLKEHQQQKGAKA